ncbi:MAG TPA: SDR family NAD(P)-dependent oxidoreductase [Cellulomonas sp.]
MNLTGKVAWVVGASSGIGAAVARELVSRGAQVAISARRPEQLAAVSAGTMLSVPADVTDVASLRAAASRIRDELGPIDLAVLSAGYWKQMSASAWDTATFDRHVQVNLVGMSNAIAAVLPQMLARHSGVIAGLASVAGYRGFAGAEAYGATKAAQINLLESLRVHVGRSGVRITTVCPGFVRTDLTAGNDFPMPFIIESDAAGRAICDGLERERTEIVFPARMAILMKASRLVPAGAWAALWARSARTAARTPGAARAHMRLSRTVTVDKPLDTVFAYLSDFTTTTEWDPGTVRTVRSSGDGGVGTEYRNTSTFAGRQTQLTYVVQELVPNRRIALRGENATVIAHDSMDFRAADGRTEVTYTADLTFKGVAQLVAPFLRRAFVRLGDEAQIGLVQTLNRL